jgi:hypothetical protein
MAVAVLLELADRGGDVAADDGRVGARSPRPGCPETTYLVIAFMASA